MLTSVSTRSVSDSGGSNAALLQIKTELAAALVSAGVSDASASDTTPKGFPAGVSWADAYKMVTVRVEDNNPATPGTLQLSPDLLKKALAGTQTLKNLGYNDLSKFPRGTSVSGAIDTLFQNKSNGILASTLAKSGIYDLSAFPAGTSAYAAFKLIEDPEKPGTVSKTAFNSLKESYAALSGLGITSLTSFPRGTSVAEATALLEPKAASMLAMAGVSMSLFKDPTISSLKALSIISKLPDSIREMKTLPTGVTSAKLAESVNAAKKLVGLGYTSLTEFSSMNAFSSEPVTTTGALAQINKFPPADDLPVPAGTNTERLFQATNKTASRSSGAPNPLIRTVYSPATDDKVKANPVPAVKIVTAAEILAANAIYWAKK